GPTPAPWTGGCRCGSTAAAAARRTTCPAASGVPRITDQVDAQVKVVVLVPKAATRSCNMMRGQIDPRYLFDYVISTDEDCGGNGDSKFLSRLQVDGDLNSVA